MARPTMRGLLSQLWKYRLLRWTLYSTLFIVIGDRLILIFISHLNLLPTKPTIFPHQDIPESQIQTLKELTWARYLLQDRVTPILLPEHSEPSDLVLYNDLLTSIETRKDISWLVLEESRIQNALSSVIQSRAGRVENPGYDRWIVHDVANIPLLPAEQELESTYNFVERITSLNKHFETVKAAQPLETWDPAYATTFIPPFIDAPPPAIALTAAQSSEAQWQLSLHLRRREEAISYLRAHPPEPMAWAPLTDDAWQVTRKIDIDTGNLHGRKEWKPIYRRWDLEDGTTGWMTEKRSEEEERVMIEELERSNEEWSARMERVEEYVREIRGG